jgi:very-short-patch-repair endonuclease
MRVFKNKAEQRFFNQIEAAVRACGFEIVPQQRIHNFIVDFYLSTPERRGVIEIDGIYHNTRLSQYQDQKRDQFLNHFGFGVLRLADEDAPACSQRALRWLRELTTSTLDERVQHELRYRQWLLQSGYPFLENGYLFNCSVENVFLLSGKSDIAVAQRLAGHSNLNTTAIYDRRGKAAEKKAVEDL